MIYQFQLQLTWITLRLSYLNRKEKSFCKASVSTAINITIQESSLRKRLVREKTIRESYYPGNDRIPNWLAVSLVCVLISIFIAFI